MENKIYDPALEVRQLFSETDMYVDYDRWVSGEAKVLIITGLSGSGKSTTASRIANKFKCDHINLDWFSAEDIMRYLNKTDNEGSKKNPIAKYLVAWIKGPGSKYCKYNKDINRYTVIFKRSAAIREFMHFILNSNHQRMVIESIDIFMNPALFDIVKNYPIIVKETSKYTSNKRANIREGSNRLKRFFEDIGQPRSDRRSTWYRDMYNDLNKFENKLKSYKKDSIESSKNEIYKEKLYPVYVLVMHTGTPLSNAIQKYTKDEYSHSSLSFDTSLNSLFSFGTKYSNKPFANGFTREDIRDAFFKERDIKYALYAVFVPHDEYLKMKKNLYNIMKNDKELKYNLRGLVKYAMGMNPESKGKLFCSEFIAMILNSDHQRTNDRAAMTKPVDLTKMKDVYLVNQGSSLKNYDKKISDRNVARIMNQLEKRK